MHKECACCGNLMYDLRRQLCFECVKKYSAEKGSWPLWLQDRAKSIQNELDKSRRHDDLPLYDESLIATKDSGMWKELNHKGIQKNTDPEDDEEFDYCDYTEIEYDEWGNEIETIDGFRYVDVDRVIDCEKREKHYLRAINNGFIKPSIPKEEILEKLRKARVETHLYEDRHKYE